jgi:hypothetical protein
MVWPNLINWLAHLNPDRQYYLGSPMQIGETLLPLGVGHDFKCFVDHWEEFPFVELPTRVVDFP